MQHHHVARRSKARLLVKKTTPALTGLPLQPPPPHVLFLFPFVLTVCVLGFVKPPLIA